MIPIKESLCLVTDLPSSPLGTILAWVMKPTAGSGNWTELPDGWVRCDGSVIPHPSIWAGELTPDLNHARRFLRGGPDSSMLTMEEDQLQDHKHVFSDPGHYHGVTDPGHHHSYDDELNQNTYYGVECGNRGCSRAIGENHKEFSKTTSSKSTGISVDSHSTGVSVTGVTSSYRHGSETRPKNMNVIYIMRVW